MALVDDAQAILGRTLMPGALDMVTADLNARLRVKEMEETYTAVPDPALPLPSFFIEAVSVDIDGRALEPTTTQLLRSGTFAIAGQELRLADGGQLLTMDYVARIPGFEEERANRVYTAFPALFLYGLLTHHATLARDDDGASRWGRVYEAALHEANARDARARQSQISMRPVPRYVP